MAYVSLASGANLEAATKGRILADAPWVAESLAAATQAVRNACGWHVGPPRVETDLRLDGSGSRIQRLPSLHVTAIATLNDNGVDLIPDVDFDWSENGVLERGRWSRKRRGITVTFTHGHALEDIPDVVNLVTVIAARAVASARSGGAVREQAGSNSIELAKIGGFISAPINATVLSHELILLEPYILPQEA